MTEKDICKVFGVTPEILHANINEEDILYMEQIRQTIYGACMIPSELMVRNNG